MSNETRRPIPMSAADDREIAKQHHKCRHFNGIQHKTCEAGVSYVTVRDESGSGPYRWPCLTLIGSPIARTVCEKREHMTDVEHAEERAAIMQACAEALAQIAAGKCHVCGAKVEAREQVGRCAYAKPCGHRIG